MGWLSYILPSISTCPYCSAPIGTAIATTGGITNSGHHTRSTIRASMPIAHGTIVGRR